MLSENQRAAADALLDTLLDLPEAARWEHWRSLTVADPEVREEIESFLRAAQSLGDFLSGTAPLPGAAADDLTGSLLGGWRITGRIGHGGMGEVYEAVRARGDFDQHVAIKVLRHEAHAELERFQAERRILARLDHPAIAHLLDGGATPDGRPYMVMEYVQGLHITQYCATTRADLATRLQLFAHVCEAMAYAHSNLIVHRDLKPSNILVTAGGQVKVLDFGIAKLLDGQPTALHTLTQAPLTPSSAAPEQLLGKPATTATDTFALGVLLFELLTGTHPWISSGAPIAQAVRAVLNQPAPLASVTAQGTDRSPVSAQALRGDLDAIISKALRAEPAQRYITADSLRLDIERHLRGEPVEARSGARLYVLGRTLRRHRAAAAALLLVLVSLAGGLGMAAWQARRADIERDIARRDAAREEAVRYGLTRIFRKAISDEGSDKATAKGMIDLSSQRVLQEYRQQPGLAGPLVLSLADLYGALEDVEGAGNLLEGFVAENPAGADPAILADARQKLANIELLRGHTARCAQLLDQAQAFWDSAPKQYAEERLEGLGTRAKLQRIQGHLDQAILTSRTAIEQRAALSGRNDREMANLYNSLAITLTSASRLAEALAAYQETLDIYQAIGLGDGLDAQIIRANLGTLELRTGRVREAREQLRGAIERERSLAGNSAAVAAAMGQYGRALWILGQSSQAVAALREAVTLGVQFAGANSPVALQNRLFLGEAQIGAGDLDGAHVTLSAALAAAHAQYGDTHPVSLRAKLAYARWTMVSGPGGLREAQQAAVTAIAALRQGGPAANASLAEGLELLGTILLRQRDNAAATDSLTEAVALRAVVGSQSWELAHVRGLLGQALVAGGHVAEGRAVLQQAIAVLAPQLGADHPETLQVQRALAQST
ncbi:MAG TPA: serine/threonine-protein kinase [Steroidobacteraceae bacterium]|nr:serine/threonine-protein kinase [Steroidobacteraceae bacterium]